MASILVYSEKQEVGFELLTKARELAGAMGLSIAAAAINDDAGAYASRGASVVFAVKNDQLGSDAALTAQALEQAAKAADAAVILIGSTRRGKETAARLAQKLSAGCITDVTGLELKDGKLVCSRNAFGGATVAVQNVTTPVQIISIMPRSCEPAAADGAAGEVKELAVNLAASRVKVVETAPKNLGSVDIEGAEVLVCVGKGLANQTDLGMVDELAAALGGLVACSKPVATDQKWLPEERIVGLSGKKGKPQLAICLGISGQVQFTVGVRDAKCIVSVNTDQNAYIFQMSDYGIVGDLHQIVPQLTKAIKG